MYIADHQHAEAKHDPSQHLVPWQVTDHRLGVQRGLAEPIIGGKGHPSGRTWQAGEMGILATSLLNVESRQPHHGTRRKKKAEDPLPAGVLKHSEIHDQTGRGPEGDRIDQ